MNTMTTERPAPTPDAPDPRPNPNRSRAIVAGLVLGAAAIVGGALGISRGDGPPPSTTPVVDARVGGITGRIGAGSIAETVAQLEARVDSFPNDDVALATLGIAYVDQARITGDTSLYARADDVLARSMEVNDHDNFLAHTGRAAVAAARHDFPTAEREARAGLTINGSNATLWGVLSDAQIQLGEYDLGFASVERMGELVPDVASITRAAYVAELQGDRGEAQRLMERALDQAFGPDDRAFALFQLGELEIGRGRPNEALGYFLEALEASPSDISAQSGKAHALGLAGQTETAISNYEQLVEQAPLADFMIELGEFLEGAGRTAEAETWYQRAREQISVDERNGVRPDAGLIFFEADHGDPAVALQQAEAALAERQFFELHEAHGWALYRNGRFDEAAAAIDEAARLGIEDPELFVRSALIRFELGELDAARDELATARAIDPLAVPYLTDAESDVLVELDS